MPSNDQAGQNQAATGKEVLNVVRRYISAVNTDQLDQIEAILADNVQWSSPAGRRTGREETRKYMERWFGAFPDLKLEEIHTFSEGDQAVAICRLKGTHQKEFISDLGRFAPTGKKINVELINVVKVQNGKLVEIRAIYDSAAILKQLGVEAEKRAA